MARERRRDPCRSVLGGNAASEHLLQRQANDPADPTPPVVTRILFDALSLDGHPSGTRTRLVRLVPSLLERGFDVAVAHRPELDPDARRALVGARLLEVRHPPRNPLSRLVLQPFLYQRLLSSERPDVVSAETWPMPNCPGLIPVIHDLRYLQLQPHLRLIFVEMLRRASSRAVRLHVVSEVVRAELIATGLVDAQKVDTVSNIVELPDMATCMPHPTGQAEPYVLVVGHAERRKDHALVHALAGAIRSLGAEVVTVGRSEAEGAARGYRAGRVRTAERTAERSRGIGGGAPPPTPVRNLGIVSDPELARLYFHARAVLAPSRYEGFGLVPLEALAAGAWVVASDIPPHREVLGEAVTYFQPGDVAGAVASLRRALLATDAERQTRAKAGRARAAMFSPSRAASCFERSVAAAGLGISSGSGRRPGRPDDDGGPLDGHGAA